MTAPKRPARSARDVATRVLHRVADEGAWAAPTLDAELGRARLDRRDAGLATEIVYGTLRALPRVDAALAAHLHKPAAALDGLTRAALRAGAYQALFLGRVPPHAAVSGAVEIVRRERGARLGGLVNAVLRKVARERPDEPSPPQALEVPGWVADAVREGVGAERARAFLASRELPPAVCLRVDGDRATVARDIEAAVPVARVEEGRISPRALLVHGAGDPRRLPGYPEGRFAVQEQGAQAVALLCGVRPAERVVDACAGHGGKTAVLARAVGPTGRVLALDLHEPKLERIAPELGRLGVDAAVLETAAVDLAVGTGGHGPEFDRVLVDAPCTGLGTVHRRPELLLRLGPEDPARMAELQLAILRRAAALVRPGGQLVYAVCSPTREEGAGVAERLREAVPELVAADEPWPLDTVGPDDDGGVRLGPWDGECDGYQVFRWRRSSSSA